MLNDIYLLLPADITDFNTLNALPENNQGPQVSPMSYANQDNRTSCKVDYTGTPNATIPGDVQFKNTTGYGDTAVLGSATSFVFVRDGSFNITIDSDSQDITAIDFSGDAVYFPPPQDNVLDTSNTYVNIAKSIQTKLRAIGTGGYTNANVIVKYFNYAVRFVIQSGTNGSVANIFPVSPLVGTDISQAAYLGVFTSTVEKTWVVEDAVLLNSAGIAKDVMAVCISSNLVFSPPGSLTVISVPVVGLNAVTNTYDGVVSGELFQNCVDKSTIDDPEYQPWADAMNDNQLLSTREVITITMTS